MSRRLRAVLLIACLPWALGQAPMPPLVTPGGTISAAAIRAALDFRADAIAVVRDTVIAARRQQVALRDLVSTIEGEAGVAGADVAGPLEDPADPWAEANIVAGQVARAAALNDVFGTFAEDLNNIREFQGLLLRDSETLVARIVALEALAGIDDAADLPPPAPNEDVVVVPHVFEAGAVMRASEMNANLGAVDEGTAAESTMAAAILARLAQMAERAEALAVVFEPQPTFTWRLGTLNSDSGLRTESYFIFENPGVFEPITIRMTGPNGYERETTITNPSSAGASWNDDLLPTGTYSAQATVGGQDFDVALTYDATRVLGLPVGELLNVSSGQVDVRVARIDGAEYYDLSLRPVDGGWVRWITPGVFASDSATFTFADLELDPALSYEVRVRAYTVPAPWDPRLVPQQVDRSLWSERFSPPVVGE